MNSDRLSHPYRTQDARGAKTMKPVFEGEVVVFLGLWALSLLRVIGAVWYDETFGVEATLALAVVVLLPWLLRGLVWPTAHKPEPSATEDD